MVCMQILWKTFLIPLSVIGILLYSRLIHFDGALQGNFIKELRSSYLDIISIFLMNLVFAWSFFRSHYEAPRVSRVLLLFLLSLGSYLLISFIQTSLPLALGMLGALSIIRFRTPIKDPLELVFIFSSVVVGVGFGAKQIDLTIIGFICLFGIVEFLKSIDRRRSVQAEALSATLVISFVASEVDAAVVESYLFKNYGLKILKLDKNGENYQISFKVQDGEKLSVLELTENLKKVTSGSFNLFYSTQPSFDFVI